MKLFLLLLFFLINTFSYSQGTSCASPVNLANGGCLTQNSFPGSANMAGTCVGGSVPTIFIRFVAGTCSQFLLNSNSSLGTDIGYAIRNPDCTIVSGGVACISNVVANRQFTISSINSSGTQLLTPGNTYILQIWGAIGSTRSSICYNANTFEELSNECGGAISLGTSTQSFFNGGDCSHSGSFDDVTTTDPIASQLCAGSLENSQWVRFSPQSGVSSFQISGSNISCIGGGCGFQFGIFSGSCSSLTSEGCYGNKVCSGGQPISGPTNVGGGLANITWSNTTTSSFTATFTPTTGLSFTGSEVFYLVMDGNADSDCNYDLVGVNIITLLDFQLIYFNVKYENEKVRLYWTIQNDDIVDEFSIERSFDGFNFNKISDVDVSCFSTERFEYEYTDYNLFYDGYVYYRLKWVINNTTHYSNVVVISSDKPSNNNISVYPNPFNDQIKIQNIGDYIGSFEVKIYNTTGKEVLYKVFEFGNVNEIELNTKELTPGTYSVIVKTNEMTKIYKIIK